MGSLESAPTESGHRELGKFGDGFEADLEVPSVRYW